MWRDALRPDQFRRSWRAGRVRGGAEQPGTTRSPATGEHGEDCEHRTLTRPSTVAVLFGAGDLGELKACSHLDDTIAEVCEEAGRQ